jgi:ankyrin repeat protein
MDQQQHDEPEEQQQPPPDTPPVMEETMGAACFNGHVDEVMRRLDAGEDVNGVHSGSTHVMWALRDGHLALVRLLHDRGADLSIVDSGGRNALHFAASNGNVYCIEYVFANTMIDINSTANNGATPIMYTIHEHLMASKLLIERSANLFMKSSSGERAIDDDNGPQVLQHALDLRWSSVKQLLFISNFHENSDDTFFSSSSSIIPQRHSSHLAASVFTITGLVRHIAEYLIRTELIVRDPATKNKDKEPDDVRKRIEATLAAAEESNRRARNN